MAASRRSESSRARATGSRIERYYTKIVVAFVVLTVVLVGLIGYFSFAKTVIVVTARPSTQPLEFETTLKELGGVIVLTDVEGSHQATNLETTEQRTGRSTGTVTIINNYTQDQPLVETTRLLSSEGVLFRTQETVTVPAGGSVEVTVAADEEGPAGDIGPSRFEVVALWEGLKDQIYAESRAPMTGGSVAVGVASATDIANAQAALRSQLEEQALQVFIEEVPTYEGLPENPYLLDTVTVVEELQNEVDVTAGQETDHITATQRLTMAAAVVDATKLTAAVQAQVDQAVPEGMAVIGDLSLDQATLSLGEISQDLTDAKITVTIDAEMTLAADHEILSADRYVNMSEAEVRSYLEGFEEVAAVRLEFSPFWVTRTPALAENIEIRLE
jgi:hypothetical protein